MQIPYKIAVTIAIYIASVAEITWSFPDYTARCPLCGGLNCAVRIGFYYRKKVVIDFVIYKDVPIPRWLCRQKGHRKSKHKTFSLLPHPLIPYYTHALNVILETVNFQNQTGTTFEHTKSYISENGLNTDIPLENNQIYDFKHLFSEAFSKLNAIAEIKQQIKKAGCLDPSSPIGTVLKFVEGYESPFLSTQEFQASNVEKLALDYFYQFQSGPLFGRHFLFGTPSQKRT